MGLALEVRNVTAAYGSTPVLDGVDLEVHPGELVAVLGPSGCGKTTLLRAIAGLAPLTGGHIAVGGRAVSDPVHRVGVRERRVGLVFQDYALFPDLSVRANVAFAPTAEPTHVAALLELTGLTPLADRLPRQLSGGQQQRVALARALAAKPEVLLLDEPFANLDPALRGELGLGVVDLLREQGCAAVLVTHDREDALGLAERVAVLLPGPTGGRVAAFGAPETLWKRPPSPEVATVVSSGALLDGAWVRPDQVRFASDPAGKWTVAACRFRGPHVELGLEADGARVWSHTERPLPRGTRGALHVDPDVWRFDPASP